MVSPWQDRRFSQILKVLADREIRIHRKLLLERPSTRLHLRVLDQDSVKCGDA